jgi:hypothetical protein
MANYQCAPDWHDDQSVPADFTLRIPSRHWTTTRVWATCAEHVTRAYESLDPKDGETVEIRRETRKDSE